MAGHSEKMYRGRKRHLRRSWEYAKMEHKTAAGPIIVEFSCDDRHPEYAQGM